MLSILNAIKTRLETTGRTVYLVDVPEGKTPVFPYYLVWSTAGDLKHLDLSGKQRFIDESIGVTSAGLSPETTLETNQDAREKLLNWTPTASGWHAQELRLGDSQRVQPDRDVTLPNSNRHPYFAVDLYDLVAEKI